MYQLIIVNDRNMNRVSLATYVEWEYLGFQIAGKFQNMESAVSFIQENPVDAILTFMTPYQNIGAEITRYVRDHYPRIKVVMIGEYKAYDYVCAALRYGACEYLAKPIEREELYRAFERARHLLDTAREAEHAEMTLPFASCDGELSDALQEVEERLHNAVSEGRTDEVYTLHAEWFDLLRGQPNSYLFFAIYQMLDRLYERYHSMGIQLEEHLQRTTVLQHLSEVEIPNLSAQCGKLLVDFRNYLTNKKVSTDGSMIEHAKRFIEQHLTEDFSMEDVAKSVFLSPSYFSREFKSQTGENVINYVIRRRMEMAIELVRTEKYSVQEICAMVGYKDVKYFHRAFKKHTGYTVKEYQKLMT